MMADTSRIELLRTEISKREAELSALRADLLELESQSKSHTPESSTSETPKVWPWPMQAEEYTRYGRQMILPEVGLPGQLRLRSSSILIIGLGGLGCPATAYLAGAGVGTLGLIDGDEIEVSNLHRQILHSSSRVGMKKVDSAVVALRSINPLPIYRTYPEHLDPKTALEIFPQYDLILDCTDTPQTRYLISDAAVLSGRPLISASALRTDGQIVILNHPPTPPLEQRSSDIPSGPCYRCVFPKPPPPESVTSCGEGGILGPVVGVMGVLMALEALKLVMSGTVSSINGQDIPSLASMTSNKTPIVPSLTMLSASEPGLSAFRKIRLKGKRPDCSACGKNASITADHLTSGGLDYAVFCGIADPISSLDKEERIDVKDFSKNISYLENAAILKSSIVLDVRDEAQFSICSLPGSINIPWSILSAYPSSGDEKDPLLELKSQIQQDPSSTIYAICRLGNDSQLAVKKLQEINIDLSPSQIKDVDGGFKSWKQNVDKDWPEY